MFVTLHQNQILTYKNSKIMKTKEVNKAINAEYKNAVASAKTLKSAIRDYKEVAFTVDTTKVKATEKDKHIITLCVLCGVNRDNVDSMSALEQMASINKIKDIIINNYPHIGHDEARSVVYLTPVRRYFAKNLENIVTVFAFAEVTDHKKVIKITAKNMRQHYVDTCNGKKVPSEIQTVKVNMSKLYYTDATLTTPFDATDYKEVTKDNNGNWIYKPSK